MSIDKQHGRENALDNNKDEEIKRSKRNHIQEDRVVG